MIRNAAKQRKNPLFALCYESKTSNRTENSVNPKSMKKSGIYQKMVKEGRVHPDCINACNPYHSCATYCYERMGKAPEMHARENSHLMQRSKERHQIEDTKAHETHAKEQVSENTQKNEKSIEEYEEMPKSFAIVDEIKNCYERDNETDDSDRRVEEGGKSSKRDEEFSEVLTGPFIGSMNSNISEITVAYEDEEDDDDPSMNSNSRVSVGHYFVKPSNSSILQAILNKHGDVAANCRLESALMRSYYLDSVCFVIRELQSVLFLQLTRTKVRELSAIIKDADSVGLNVGWLRGKIDEIGEAMELISRHSAVKAAKAKCQQSMEIARKELAFLGEGGLEEKAVEGSRTRVSDAKNHLRELAGEAYRLNESYLEIRRKVESINIKSVSDELML